MTHFKPRPDAVIHNGRYIVPTIYDNPDKTKNTIWVHTWDDFYDVGGVTNFNEDQTEVILTLPTQHKFSTKFPQH